MDAHKRAVFARPCVSVIVWQATSAPVICLVMKRYQEDRQNRSSRHFGWYRLDFAQLYCTVPCLLYCRPSCSVPLCCPHCIFSYMSEQPTITAPHVLRRADSSRRGLSSLNSSSPHNSKLPLPPPPLLSVTRFWTYHIHIPSNPPFP